MTPTAGVTYSITGITGTYNRDSVPYTITGLSSFYGTSSTFQWNGTLSSPILSNYDGISFSTSSSNEDEVNMYFDNTSYSPINSTVSTFPDADDSVVSSTLTPVPWETDALPVVGTTILFGFGVWAKRKSAKPIQK